MSSSFSERSECLLAVARKYLSANSKAMRLAIVEAAHTVEMENSFNDYVWHMEHDDKSEYAEPRRRNDLALVAVMGDFIDPRDVTAALDAIVRRSVNARPADIKQAFEQIAEIAREHATEWLVERIRSYPSLVLRL